MIFMILIPLFIIFTKVSLLNFILILLLMFIFIVSNWIIGINPYSKEMHFVRIMSFCSLLILLYINTTDTSIVYSTIIPFSRNGITFFKDYNSELSVNSKTEFYSLYHCDLTDVANFLNILEDNKDYLVNIYFIPFELNEDITLSEAILVNKLSNKYLLLQHIVNCLLIMDDKYDHIIFDLAFRVEFVYQDVKLVKF